MLTILKKFNSALLVLALCATTQSCSTTKPSQTQESFELEDEVDLTQDSNKSQSLKLTQKSLSINHPTKATAWHTRKSIMVHPQPNPSQIIECKETAESAVQTASNIRSIDEAALSIESKIAQSPKVYHWCFYQLMADLDLKMERDLPLLTEKKELFLSRMKVLWVLARSLDENYEFEGTPYMTYLRKRYIEISQHEFGRSLEVMDSDPPLLTAGKNGKPAAEFEEP